jgi:PAS domain S-box-containing protein
MIVMGKMPNKDELRRRAEEKVEMLVRKNLAQHLGEVDAKELLHELQVHMVELAMQNEELKATQETLEKANDRYRALYDSAPVCYLTLDNGGVVYEANQTAALLLNLTRDRLIGQYFQSFLEPDSADSFHLFLQKSLSPQSTTFLKLGLKPHGGAVIKMSLSINAEYDRSTMPVRYRVVLVDIRRFKQEAP